MYKFVLWFNKHPKGQNGPFIYEPKGYMSID